MLGQRRYRSQHAVGSPSHEATHCTPPRMSMKVRRVRRVLAPQEAIEEDHEKIPRMKVRRVRRVIAPQETIEDEFFLAHVLGWYAPRPHPPPLGFTRNASSNQVPAGFSSSIEKGGRG